MVVVLVLAVVGLGATLASSGNLFEGNMRPFPQQNVEEEVAEKEEEVAEEEEEVVLPDLAIYSIATDPFGLDGGNLVVRTTNMGGDIPSNDSYVGTGWTLLPFYTPIEDLEAGETSLKLFNSFPIEFCVDPEDRIEESDESNNCDTFTIDEVVPASLY